MALLCLNSLLLGIAGPSCQDEPAEITAVQSLQREQGEAGSHPSDQGGAGCARYVTILQSGQQYLVILIVEHLE